MMTTSIKDKNELIKDSAYVVFDEAKCLKLKAIAKDYLHYQIGQHSTTKEFALCITGNDNAGLHSKEWISFNAIHTLLSQYTGDFRSSIFTPLFQSKSRNNVGFLVAVLKSDEIGLLKQAVGYQFQYCKVEQYEERLATLHRQWEGLTKGKGNQTVK